MTGKQRPTIDDATEFRFNNHISISGPCGKTGYWIVVKKTRYGPTFLGKGGGFVCRLYAMEFTSASVAWSAVEQEMATEKS